jgi:hypothetical protein
VSNRHLRVRLAVLGGLMTRRHRQSLTLGQAHSSHPKDECGMLSRSGLAMQGSSPIEGTGTELNTFNLRCLQVEWWEDQGEESAWRWPQGPVGSFAWVVVAAFCFLGVGPAELAGVDQVGDE